jgi:SAM-dependent methyltransferase
VAGFLASRGWAVAFCVPASPQLFARAAALGLLQQGGDPAALRRRVPAGPCALLREQAPIVEALLAAGQARACPGTPLVLRCLDLGCGSGRDLMWLASRASHACNGARDLGSAGNGDEGRSSSGAADAGAGTAADVEWSVLGVDSWLGSLQRASEACALVGLPGSRVRLLHASVEGGELRPVQPPHSPPPGSALHAYWRPLDALGADAGCDTAGARPSAAGGGAPPGVAGAATQHEQEGDLTPRLGTFDLVLVVRFLARGYLPRLASLLRPGGVVLYCHFTDGPGAARAREACVPLPKLLGS